MWVDIDIDRFLKGYEVESYANAEVMQESEFMVYGHNQNEQHR
jgi:hypothetical protein